MKVFNFLFLLIFFTNTNIIGYLDTKSGANVRYFTTLPGSRGKPNIVTNTATGLVPIYDICDWIKIDPRLKGNHTWYKVDPTNSFWIFKGKFEMKEKK